MEIQRIKTEVSSVVGIYLYILLYTWISIISYTRCWNRANQLRLMVYPIIYKVSIYIPGGCLGLPPTTVRTSCFLFSGENHGNSDALGFTCPQVGDESSTIFHPQRWVHVVDPFRWFGNLKFPPTSSGRRIKKGKGKTSSRGPVLNLVDRFCWDGWGGRILIE